MNVRTLLLLLMAAALPTAIMGCSSASNATDTTFSYIRGDQRATLGASPQQITDSTLAAAQELELPVDSHVADGLVGKVTMHTADGTKVEVNVKAIASAQSEVTVRVGTFGDKVLQQRILDKIKAHLITGAPEATAAAAPVVSPHRQTSPPAPAPVQAEKPASPSPSAAPSNSAVNSSANSGGPPSNPLSPSANPPSNPLSPATPPSNPLSPPAPANPLSPATPPATAPGF